MVMDNAIDANSGQGGLPFTQMIGLSIERSAWFMFFTQFVNPF
jgi:hypothetical protein